MDEYLKLIATDEELYEDIVNDIGEASLSTMTNNQVRDAYQKRKTAHHLLQGIYNKAKAEKNTERAIKYGEKVKLHGQIVDILKGEVSRRAKKWFSDYQSGNLRNTPGHDPSTFSKSRKLPGEYAFNREEEEMDNENQDQEDQEHPAAILVKSVFDEKPQQFVDNFDALMRDRVSELVAQRKLELQQDLFGAPEGLETDEAPEETAEVPAPQYDDTPPEGVEIDEADWHKNVKKDDYKRKISDPDPKVKPKTDWHKNVKKDDHLSKIDPKKSIKHE